MSDESNMGDSKSDAAPSEPVSEQTAGEQSVSEEAAAARAEQKAHSVREETIAPEADKKSTAFVLGEVRRVTPLMSDDEARREINRRARRGFLIMGAAAVAGYVGYRRLWTAPDATGVPAPFRRAFEFNEQVSQAYFSPTRLAPEFPRSSVGELRVNGGEGLSEGFNPDTWRLQVVGLAQPQRYPQFTENVAYDTAMDNMHAGDESSKRHENPSAPDAKVAPGAPPPPTMDRAAAMQMAGPGLLLTLADIRALPRTEMTTEFKCVEGWSVVVHWAGARFADFITQFQPLTRDGSPPDINRPDQLPRYVSLVTPDGGYFVGMDILSALHRQTLLCYEMNGAPLTLAHGAPLRIVTPTKYGYKQIKRIGRITFTDTRPADYWAERGYDYDAGH